jgi:hypothetical protein
VCSSLALLSESGPVGLPPVPWAETAIERSPYLSYRLVFAATETWTDNIQSFFSGLQTFVHWAKKAVELRGKYDE